jgi:hypothetical protein
MPVVMCAKAMSARYRKNVDGIVLTSSGDVDVVATRLHREAKAPARVEEKRLSK